MHGNCHLCSAQEKLDHCKICCACTLHAHQRSKSYHQRAPQSCWERRKEVFRSSLLSHFSCVIWLDIHRSFLHCCADNMYTFRKRKGHSILSIKSNRWSKYAVYRLLAVIALDPCNSCHFGSTNWTGTLLIQKSFWQTPGTIVWDLKKIIICTTLPPPPPPPPLSLSFSRTIRKWQ